MFTEATLGDGGDEGGEKNLRKADGTCPGASMEAGLISPSWILPSLYHKVPSVLCFSISIMPFIVYLLTL